MLINTDKPAKILVSESALNDLLRTAQASLDLLKQIQEDTEVDPFYVPWPEIDELEQAIQPFLNSE